MQTYIRISAFLLVTLSLTAGDCLVLAAGQQQMTTGRAATGGKIKVKPPAAKPVMGPVKWMPDPVESPLRSAYIPLQCTETQTVVGASAQSVPIDPNPYLLDCWLEAHPTVAFHINWQIPGPTLVQTRKDWPEERKAALRAAFHNALLWHESGLTDYPGFNYNEPIENQEAPYFNQQAFVRTVLDEDSQALPLYLSTTAHVLAAEIFGWVPWSIRDMPPGALDTLLSGYKQFYRDFNDATWYDTIYPGIGVWGESTPAHPAYTYKFLVDNNLIGATQTETIERVLDWARWNLWHFSGEWNWDNLFHTWDYYGAPPVARVIEGTVLTHPYYQNGNHPWGIEPHHWTAGCFGTSAFLVNVLRLANIPVTVIRENAPLGGHTTTYFPTIQRYMTHGDDPYDALSKGFESFPARQMLIDQSMYDAWFPPNVPLEQQIVNVGRRPAELSIFFPPQWMLDSYCSDQANLLSHANGQVAAYYQTWFTLDELESMLTWQRLDKAVQLHGCVM